jgi:hypothetical protein
MVMPGVRMIELVNSDRCGRVIHCLVGATTSRPLNACRRAPAASKEVDDDLFVGKPEHFVDLFGRHRLGVEEGWHAQMPGTDLHDRSSSGKGDSLEPRTVVASRLESRSDMER